MRPFFTIPSRCACTGYDRPTEGSAEEQRQGFAVRVRETKLI
jgi:hypothetical protein